MSRKTGSIKKGIVAPDLLEERAKCAFDQQELTEWVMGDKEKTKRWKHFIDLFGADPELRNKVEFYDLTPHEMQEDLWKRINVLYNKHQEEVFVKGMI